jgi:hypothetical protein
MYLKPAIHTLNLIFLLFNLEKIVTFKGTLAQDFRSFFFMFLFHK